MSSRSVARAYEERLASPPPEGLSPDALAARLEVMRVAAAVLSDPGSRDLYGRSLKGANGREALLQDVPLPVLPGALSLLQECGEAEAVVSVGTEALRQRGGRAFASDVAVCMALARCDLGRDAMARRPPDVVGGCAQLEEARDLLRGRGALGLRGLGGSPSAPRLLEAVEMTLGEMKPRQTIERLALPLSDDHATTRMLGSRALRELLWSPEGGQQVAAAAAGDGAAGVGGGVTDLARFKAAAYAQMKSHELTDHFDAAPRGQTMDTTDLYTAALANVAVGFRRRDPRRIREADRLLGTLQVAQGQSADPAAPEASTTPVGAAAVQIPDDVSLERAMCALLLGRPAEARQWLKLNVTAGGAQIRRSPAAQFVIRNSETDDEFLLGLCKLAERWLSEAVFARFRDAAGERAALNDYFDNRGVRNALERIDMGTVGAAWSRVTGAFGWVGDAFKDPPTAAAPAAPTPTAAPTPEEAADLVEAAAAPPAEQAPEVSPAAVSDETPKRPVRQPLPLAVSEPAVADADVTDAAAGAVNSFPAANGTAVPPSEVAAEEAAAPMEGGPAPIEETTASVEAAASAESGSETESDSGSDEEAATERLARPAVPGYVARMEAARAKAGAPPMPTAPPSPIAPPEAVIPPPPPPVTPARWDVSEVSDAPVKHESDDPSEAMRTLAGPREPVKANPAALVFVGALVCAYVFVVPRTPLSNPKVLVATLAAPFKAFGAALGGVASALGSALPSGELSNVPRVSASSGGSGGAAPKGSRATGDARPLTRMDSAAAARLLRRWQAKKAAALGGKHDISGLPGVLGGMMLEQWTARAEESLRNGWYWKYELVSVKVDSVTPSAGGSKATVECTLQETAQLYDGGQPDLNDSYKAKYQARYVMEWFPEDVCWKITSGVVLPNK